MTDATVRHMVGGAYDQAEREADRFELSDDWRDGRATVQGIAIDPRDTIERDDAIAVYGGYLMISIVDTSVIDPLRQQSIVQRAAKMTRSFYNAKSRGQKSIYMLPQALVSKIGIKRQVPTPTITCGINLDDLSNGLESVVPEVGYSVLTAETTSYGAVNKHIDMRARKRSSLLKNSTQIGGVLELSSIVDVDGISRRMDLGDISYSQKLVASTMVAANIAMANYFEEHNIRGIYRGHAYGSAAFYCLQQNKHAGLNASRYMHFTSPLRRYTDMLNHLALSAHLDAEFVAHGALEKEALRRACQDANRMSART